MSHNGLFTCTVNVTVFVSGTSDLFNVTCKRCHRTVLNPFFNGTNMVTLTVRVKETQHCYNTLLRFRWKVSDAIRSHCCSTTSILIYRRRTAMSSTHLRMRNAPSATRSINTWITWKHFSSVQLVSEYRTKGAFILERKRRRFRCVAWFPICLFVLQRWVSGKRSKKFIAFAFALI